MCGGGARCKRAAVKIVIVGAGIGGLTAAALLGRSGHEVIVLEKARALSEVGAGIQISPNAARVLASLGLADGLAAVGTAPRRIVLRRWQDDAELFDNPLGDAVAERFGFPFLNVYRPDLIALLATACANPDGAPANIDVRMRADVVCAHTNPEGALVELADGSSIAADVVIGADGIHSPVRASVFGVFPTRFSGFAAYRALVPREAVPSLPFEVTNRVGPGRHIVSYFVGRDQRHFNLVCVVPEASWEVESWTEPGNADELRSEFVGWADPLQSVLALIVEPVYRWALHDREPLPRWTRGRIALLGDACHPMLPFMAQGACQAIEDAAVLNRCLAEFGAEFVDEVASEVHELSNTTDDGSLRALTVYESARKSRTSILQAGSWGNATLFHLPDGPEQRQRDERYRATSGAHAVPGGDWLFGYDALTAPLPDGGERPSSSEQAR